MADLVNAKPEDIRKLAGALTTFKQEVAQSSKRVRTALDAAHWHDARKQQFEGRLKDLQKQVDRFMSGEVDQMVKGLNQLAAKLDEIRNVRM